MSSGFVSGGTNEQPIERDDAWLEAQREIEDTRRRKEEEAQQDGGKSLYETLQANKAAKQEAFEESIKLKHQFRTLDEDEVEFLDSVLESTRAKEAAVKRETSEQLDHFRRQQEQADKALLEAGAGRGDAKQPDAGSPIAAGPSAEEENWAVSGRKRKKGKESHAGLKGVKLLRKSSSASASVSAGNEKQKAAASPESPGTTSPKHPGPESTAKPAGVEKHTAAAADKKEGSVEKKNLNGNGTAASTTTNTNTNGTASSSQEKSTLSAAGPAKSGAPLGLQLAAYDSDDD